MKNLFYLIVPVLFLCSCPGNLEEPSNVVAVLVDEFNLNVEGEPDNITFNCSQDLAPLYASEIRRDHTTNKFIYDQGYTSITLPSSRELIYRVIIFTEEDLSSFDTPSLESWIFNNQEAVHFEIEIREDDEIFKNQFYGFSNSSFNPLYEERNIVAENEMFSFETQSSTVYPCIDNNTILTFNLEYSAIIKTENESKQKDINLDFNIHLRAW